jgi:selenoprotein W-related protein
LFENSYRFFIMEKIITITYCAPCQFKKQAAALCNELKAEFGKRLTEIILEPSQTVGNFEVSLDGELIFSKTKSGRFPLPGEIGNLLMTRIYK